jgi:glyoxylate/hydroxypyruvate reductase A
MTAARGVMLVRSGGPAALPEWQAAFASLAPGLAVRGWDDPAVDPDAVAYVLVWEPTPGRLATFRNLRVIFSSAAGVDHITRDPDLPRHLPIVRMASDETAQTVGEYVCLGALAIIRDARRLQAAQAARRWDPFDAARIAPATRVGVMGLGNIGVVAARMLRGLNFVVAGWARSRKTIAGMETYAGMDELPAFLARSDLLVGLLPETAETRGLLDARRLALLPRGAGIVNAGRGSLIVMPDLIAALDAGQVGAAFLDVFETEPLPPDAPAWTHPRITVTSHVAGFASRPARARAVAAALAAFERGAPLPNLYDPARGY